MGTQTPPAAATPTPLIGVSFVTQAPPTAAIVQTTPTPLPTATATPSPTPIMYQIQSGDTLLAIAIQRGATVGEIEALNPGIRPELLQIGQVVQLPPPATAVAQASAGTPIPIAIRIVKVSLYRTPVGSLWVLGEVANEGGMPAENVRVQIDLRDAAGGIVATVGAWTAVAVIPAGAKAPFGTLVNDLPQATVQPVVAVIAGQTVANLGSRYLDLAATAAISQLDADTVALVGQITNTGTAVAVDPTIVATLYDNQANVTGFLQQTLTLTLAPGASADFTLSVAPPGGQSVAFTLAAQAVTAP